MDRILRIGFRRVGTWHLKDAGITYELETLAPQPHTLYAFVVNGEICYVGKTTKTLRKRLNSYARPGSTQATNLRNNANILSALKAGSTVEIFALPDDELHRYGDFHLNLAAGLEDSIISTLDPDWNGGHRAPAEEEGDTTEASDEPFCAEDTFHFTMQPTYWSHGFFNVGTANSASFGADGQTIEIFRGNEAEPILGRINRTANANGSPRIFGGKALRTWVQKHIPEMSKVRVTMLSPASLRLSLANN